MKGDDMKLTPKTKVMALIKEHGFLLDFLAGYAPEFEKLKNPIMRATVGRLATMEMAAAMACVPVDKLLADVGAEIEKHGISTDVDATKSAEPDGERVDVLKGIIKALHEGAPMGELKERFAALLEGSSVKLPVTASRPKARKLLKRCFYHRMSLQEPS
jgi:hypothetical protein